MGSEAALPFLSRLESSKASLPAVVAIVGPNAFLKEYVLDCCCAALRGSGPEIQRFQIGAGADTGALIEAASEPGLFSPAAIAVARILRAYNQREDDDNEAGAETGRSGRASSDDGALLATLARVRLPSRLIVLYERDSAPAKMTREAEKAGLVILCNRPYESQLSQYALMFARRAGLKIGAGTADLIALRYGTNLFAMHNAVALAALMKDIEPAEQFIRGLAGDPHAGGELFALSESLAGEKSAKAFALLDGALALGRDPFELLAVEILPALRRMLAAAQMGAAGRSTVDLAMALGMSPRSPMVSAAVAAAGRYGTHRLAAVYRAAIDLDANLKSGAVKDRENALSALLLELIAGQDAGAR